MLSFCNIVYVPLLLVTFVLVEWDIARVNFSNASFTFLNCIGDLILGDLQGLDADAGGYVVVVGDGRAAYVVGGGVGGGDDCGGGGGDRPADWLGRVVDEDGVPLRQN